MAEIPVEKKSSTTWLWVLLAILLAALLLWWLLGDDDEGRQIEPAGVETVGTAEPAAPADGGAPPQ